MIGTTILTDFHRSRKQITVDPRHGKITRSSVFRHKTKTYHEQLLNLQLLLVYRENIPS
jgi:hypothetical protein